MNKNTKQELIKQQNELIYSYNRANKDRVEMMVIDSKMQKKLNTFLEKALDKYAEKE